MTGATTVPREVEEYLAAVRTALADLPAAERDDLLTEVEASLADAAAETGSPLVAPLRAPEEFAAELRAAAGLHETSARDRAPSQIARRASALAERLARHPRLGSLRRLANELAPIWWVARGYLAVAATAWALDAGWAMRYPFVPRLGTAETGAAVIALAIVLSVAAGLHMRRHGSPFPRLGAVANAALAVAIVPVALTVTETRGWDLLVANAYAPAPSVPAGLSYEGLPVANIYPYSRDGRLLHDVLLYDGSGRPLEIPTNRALDPDRRVVVTNGNRPLFNAFPIRYYEPGTRRVARPNAAPYIELPLVLTPPLPKRGD